MDRAGTATGCSTVGLPILLWPVHRVLGRRFGALLPGAAMGVPPSAVARGDRRSISSSSERLKKLQAVPSLRKPEADAHDGRLLADL